MAKPTKKAVKEVFTNVLPASLRGIIKGNLAAKIVRTGGDLTNAEYAKANGGTTRHASKIRRGYNIPAAV